MKFTPAEQLEIVREASRAPSVHNIQPARWRFTDEGVTLFRALDRTIPVADPTGHDLHASLGAAWEGMAIALSVRGARLGNPTPPVDATANGCEGVMTATIVESFAAPDPLSAWVAERRSHRGKFSAIGPRDVATLNALQAADAVVVQGGSTMAELASLHDDATWTFEARPEYHGELWSWLRLSKNDPRYERDGLNADCLALSAPERWAAARLLAPRTFALLSKVGVGRALVSEAGQVKSALGAILYTPRKDTSPFDAGRRMYRLWLEITASGFHLAPMSASADDAKARETLASKYTVPTDRRIANVFRIGRVPLDQVAISPRLPMAELLV